MTVPHVVVAHPSTELYGADLQVLESVTALIEAGWRVTFALPEDGPLAARADALGAHVVRAPFPVLRKALLTPRGLLGLAGRASSATLRGARWLRAERPDAVYVNTVTIPTWLAAARLARVPALVHVHEAEEDQARAVTAALTAPLLLASAVVTNSESARRSVGRVFGGLSRGARVVPNGVPGPPAPPASPKPSAPHDGPLAVALVGRLSPRKGTDVAVDAVDLLRADGVDVTLRVAGTTFTGYEWFEDELRARVDAAGLADRVTFLGFVRPTWPELDRADVVVVPSRVEPFGNTAVEGMLAGRPVVASRTQGLAEILRDGETGLLVEPGDPADLARALARLARDPELRGRLAAAGRADALERFGTARYGAEIVAAVEGVRTAG
ncbi:glycosyltransferase [Cellulomonas alba]|uniref:Glycosyltransferase n=1 Tax=Cellulomonas alba TaxID=3053467 RepID=A0ABT7SHQ4_9CELL|nr:glycosyltransferase [Cellulomonas alba]MDM7855574.1 glycosyltransferase [Cellulomonas alba]